MIRGTHRYPPLDRVVYGVPFAEALAEDIDRTGAHAIYVLASGTLARQTDVLDQVRGALGNRLAGVCTRIGAHTPRTDVVAAANEARVVKADALLTVGGGSVTDAAKMVGLCLGNDVTDPAQLDAFRARITPDGRTERPPTKPPPARSVAVPTTLSAGEYTWFAGCTDTVRHVKESYGTGLMMPRVVVLDPAVTVHTLEWLFLSTGLRAVDHTVIRDRRDLGPPLGAVRLAWPRWAGFPQCGGEPDRRGELLEQPLLPGPEGVRCVVQVPRPSP